LVPDTIPASRPRAGATATPLLFFPASCPIPSPDSITERDLHWRRRLRRLARFGLLAGVATAGACTQEREVFAVELAVVEADAVAGVVDEGEVRFSFVTDTGDDGGAAALRGEGFALDPEAKTLSFEVVVEQDDELRALGRTGPVAVPAIAAASTNVPTLRVPVLLAPVDAPGLLIDLPPALGADVCAVADAAGRVLLVGGSTSAQSGYLVQDFTVGGVSAAGAFVGVGGAGCGVSADAFAAVGGCTANADSRLVVARGADVTVIDIEDLLDPTNAAGSLCGARVVPVDAGVWVGVAGSLYFIADGQDAPEQEVDVDVDTLLADDAGAAVAVSAGGEVVVVQRSGAVRTVRAQGRLGRRFDTLVILDGRTLLDLEGRVLRDDVDVDGDVRSFTVLADDRVVALSAAGTALNISGADGTRTLPVSSPRTYVAALPGDTLVLVGGATDGIDVVALER
jgi:hypothetical protein